MAGYDIFLSYCRKDMEFADEVYRHLNQNCGYSVFLDREAIEVGSDWGKELADAIRASNILLLLLSEYSVKSENVDKEICLALNNKKTIIPIRIQNVSMVGSGAKEYQLSTIQIIDIFDKPLDKQLGIIQDSVIAKLGQREALKSDVAHYLVSGIENINSKLNEKLLKMGTRLYCRYDNDSSMSVWLPFSVGPYGASAKLYYNGRNFFGAMDLNGQHCSNLKCMYQFLDKHFPPVAGQNDFKINVKQTAQKCNDIFHFFTYPATYTTIAPRPAEEAAKDILRISEAFFSKIVEALGDWVAYVKEFREFLSGLDKEIESIFPETEAWKITSKMSTFNGLIVYHKDALVSSRWMGLHNSNERESLLSLLVYGDQNAYNDTKICFWKPSGEIQLGIEQDLLENCKNKLGEGKGWNDVIYAQTPPPPLNHPGIITWQWKPWTSDEKDLFRRWIIEKLTAMKPIYLGALKKLETISPLEVAKASVNPVETTWKQSQVRYFMAVLIQNKIFNSLIKLEENWIVSSETNLRGYARLKKLAGQVELCIDFVFDAKSITYSIGLIAGGNQQAFSKAISQILLQNPQERINLTPVNGFLSETVQFEGKAFNERGLTLSAWLNEVESILMERLPKLLTLHKTVEVHLLEAVKLTDILTKKLSSIFPYPEWILVNEAGTLLPDKNISVFKKTWAVDSEAKIPLLQFSFEQEGFALESLFAGITGSGFPKLSQSLKETVKAVFTAEFSSDHKPEFNEWWNWVYVKDEFRHPSFIDGKNSISEKEAEFVEYVNSLFLRLKKLSPVIDVCVKEVKNAKG